MLQQGRLVVGRLLHTLSVRRKNTIHPVVNTSLSFFPFGIEGKESNPLFSQNLEKDIWSLSSSFRREAWKSCCLCPGKHSQHVDNGREASVQGHAVPLRNRPLGNKARMIIEIKRRRKYHVNKITKDKHTHRKQNRTPRSERDYSL